MIYTSLRDIAQAAHQIDMTDTAQIDRLRKLIRVYMTAADSPPDGVIGVGVITYAEDALIAAQIDSEVSQ